jgi:hypothetical protein
MDKSVLVMCNEKGQSLGLKNLAVCQRNLEKHNLSKRVILS